jgi:hypothetical protein
MKDVDIHMAKISSGSSNNNDLIRRRPTGVTILAVLFVIAGAFTQLGVITTLDSIYFVANDNPNVIGDNEIQLNGQPLLTPSEQTAPAQESGSILTIAGALLITYIPLGIEILCIASFVVAYALFTGKSWAWLVGVVLSAIGLVVNVISLVMPNMFTITGALVGIAINAIVLYYLSRKNVRQYFGKVSAARQASSSTTVGVEK